MSWGEEREDGVEEKQGQGEKQGSKREEAAAERGGAQALTLGSFRARCAGLLRPRVVPAASWPCMVRGRGPPGSPAPTETHPPWPRDRRLPPRLGRETASFHRSEAEIPLSRASRIPTGQDFGIRDSRGPETQNLQFCDS